MWKLHELTKAKWCPYLRLSGPVVNIKNSYLLTLNSGSSQCHLLRSEVDDCSLHSISTQSHGLKHEKTAECNVKLDLDLIILISDLIGFSILRYWQNTLLLYVGKKMLSFSEL